jgi:SAM-dependent methyltransferase
MTSPGTIGEHYSRELGREYFAYQEPLSVEVARLNKRLFESFVRGDATVVDFGCGSGHLLGRLRAGRRIGIEVNETARELAERRGIEVVRSADELESSIADVVISSHVLEHTRAPFQELSSLRRVLKPTGMLVMVLPLDDWRTHRRLDDDPNHHLYAWTPLTLANLLTESGYEVTRCSVVTRAVPTRLGLARLPRPLRDAAEFAWAVLRRRRQLFATATAAKEAES